MRASRTFGRASDASGGRVRARIGFDERLARRIYAGADLLLVPSRYEPCGMTQMIAMRYGAIPIARETGGLADAVRDLDLAGSLAWRSRPAQWAALIATAMAEDSSWERSAAVYAELYEAIARERRTVAEAASPVTEVDQASETASETASGGGA